MDAGAKPTVLHYTGYAWDGGGVHAVIRSLAAAGTTWAILGASPGLRRAGGAGPKVWRGPAVEGETIGPGNLLRTFRVAWMVRRWLARQPHRVFHGHSRAGLLVALWLQCLGARRVMVSVHCHARRRWFYRWAHRRLGWRLQWLTPAMKRHYGLADVSWSGCTPNGRTGEPRPVRRWVQRGELRVGGAGLLLPSKRWELVVQALGQLPRTAPIRFHHVGGAFASRESRRYAEGVRSEARRVGIEGKASWDPWRDDLEEFFREIDVLVVPSEWESFSMVALDALWLGVPVIAARTSGTECLVDEGVNGWLFPAGSAAGLAMVLDRCCRPEAWERLGGRSDRLGRFQLEEIVGCWKEHYGRL